MLYVWLSVGVWLNLKFFVYIIDLSDVLRFIFIELGMLWIVLKNDIFVDLNVMIDLEWIFFKLVFWLCLYCFNFFFNSVSVSFVLYIGMDSLFNK